MNLVLTVVSGGQQNRHVFGPQGGRFGRSQKCDWVLPDPDLILSSVHGRISQIDGAFVLTDESTNGIFIGNGGEPIGKGNSVIVSTGMRLRAGAYEIEARLAPDEAQVAGLNPYAPPGFGPAHAPAIPPQFAPQPAPSWQQPSMSQPASIPRTPGQQNNAEDALRQRGEYGDLWASNSQDPLAYLDGTDTSRGKNEPLERRPTNTIPEGFHPGAPATGFATQQPMQPTAHRPLPGPAGFPADFDAYGSRPTPLNGSGQGGFPGANLSSPVTSITPSGQGPVGQGPAGRSAIPDDFFSRLAPAAKPASQMPLLPAAPLPPPVASVPLPVAPARVPSRQDPAYTSPVTLIRNPASDNFTIPDNFDPFTSLMGSAKPADPYPGLPHVPGSAARTIPPLPAPPVQPLAPPLPDMVLPQANLPAQTDELSPALLADVVRIEPLAVVPERRATSDKDAVFDPLEALRSRREERTAALERKMRREPPPLNASPTPLMPVASAPLPPQPSAPLPAAAIPAVALASPVSGGRDAVLAALFKGMGFPDNTALPPDGEKVAENVGMMVREIGKGLVQLLSARQMLKTEFRMDETQMRPEENNPFKYYKIAELALDELFVTRSGGFQDPAKAASSAFEDVQQYVMLTTAAIQRAMTLMFQRLSPEAIAREAEGDGGLRIRGLGGGKGKWETYVENHGRMSGRLDGITRQIISEAFAQVQEEQARKAASEFWEKKK